MTIQEPSSEKIVFFQLSRGANAEAKIPKPTPLQQQLAKVAPNGYDEDGEEQPHAPPEALPSRAALVAAHLPAHLPVLP